MRETRMVATLGNTRIPAVRRVEHLKEMSPRRNAIIMAGGTYGWSEQGGARRVVPPRPPSTRKPRPYSPDDLDALLATARAFPARVMVTLKAPTSFRIVDWPTLRTVLMALKRKLENTRKRNDFPDSLAVTEFDPVEVGGVTAQGASFHVGFATTLTQGQQDLLKHWWLALMALRDNQGRAFQYDDEGGGKNLQDYLPKDMDKRTWPWRPVKFQPHWMPEHIDCRLWFVIGMKRRPAWEGRALRAREGKRRKKFEGAQGRKPSALVRVQKASFEGKQGCTYITSEPKSDEHEHGEGVGVSIPEAVALNVVERFSLTDLWEASPLRIESEKLGDVLDYIPAKPWRIVLSLKESDESATVKFALSLHKQGLLSTAYTEGEQRLVCITRRPMHIGEKVPCSSLKDAAFRPVYFLREKG